ncbi:MAG: hypothetical protein K2L98_03860 [Bacilli bacterium]|nr:hypothetical protein [Bacilli bacterium]
MKNAKMTIVAVLVALVAVTTYSVGGTYAKYTDTFDGSTDTARVAKWAIQLDQNGTTVDKTFDFDLFSSLKEADGTTAESDVTSSNSDNVIAPGTGGKIELDLFNNSEVNAEYDVQYTVETNGVPIEFSTDGGTTWTTSLSDVAAETIASGATDDIDIQWRWVFEAADGRTDEDDTNLGTVADGGTIDDLPKVTVSAKVIVTQVD